MLVTLTPNPLLTVLESDGWQISEVPLCDSRHLCRASRGKYHLVGEGETRGEAQVEVLEMVVELEWAECLDRDDTPIADRD
jgi:hypothetical protein